MTNSPRVDLRERVHAQLDGLHAPGQDLAPGARLDSSKLHAYSRGKWTIERARLHKALLDPFRQAMPGVRLNGRCAVVTAGPPGTGKSTAVCDVLGDLRAWRRIDADDFKVHLVENAITEYQMAYSRVLGRILVDTRPVMPMELSALVHLESAFLARRALGLVLQRGENVIVEGTLLWSPLVDEYSTELAVSGYESLTVIDLVSPCEIASERAKTRWWEGRLAGGLGGRFTSETAIHAMYDSAGRSRCSSNAEALVSAAESRNVRATLVRPGTPPAPQVEDIIA